MRKLASIRRIDKITPIDGADRIMTAHLGGWKVIVKKDEFKEGDLAVYFEIDSFLPLNPAYEFLRAKCLKVMDGEEGLRLKSMKMKNVISQGLLLPINSILELEGMDVTELLGVKLYEAPEVYDGPTVRLGGKSEGNFPNFIPRTDQDRLQNLQLNQVLNKNLEVTEKLDGSSCTVFFKDGVFGVCSRNINLTEDPVNQFWKTINKYDLRNQLTNLNRNIALQGELIGPGIQKNKYKLTEHEFRVFDVFDIDAQRYLSPIERHTFIISNLKDIPHVPIIFLDKTSENITMDDLLKMAEDKSRLNETVEREGIVFKEYSTERFSFKVISNKFLLKHDL